MATGPKVRLTVAPTQARVAPGGGLALTLTVHNGSDLADCYRIGVVGLQRQWYDIAERQIALAPGAEAAIALAVHPVADAAPGRYPFKVQVTSEESARAGASALVDLSVGAGDMERTAEPQPAKPSASAPPTPARAVMPPQEPARTTTPPREPTPARQPMPIADAAPRRLSSAPRRFSMWTLGSALVLLLVLVGAGIFLIFRAAPMSPTAASPVPTPGAGAAPQSPYGAVRGAVTHAPAVEHFSLVPGRRGHLARLVWSTRNTREVTINGERVAARGTRLLRAPVEGARYQLQARNGARVVTAQVRVTKSSAAIPASTAPVALFNLKAVAFRSRPIRTSAPAPAVRIVNLGPASLVVSGIAISGKDAADFSMHSACMRRALRPDDGCAIDVGFTPRGRGARSARLIITDNTATSPQTVTLSGIGR